MRVLKKQVFTDESIKINHFISVDDNNTMNYLKYYDNIKTVEVEKKFQKNTEMNFLIIYTSTPWYRILKMGG